MNKSKKRIAIINGPNINILGIREPNIYGCQTWEEIEFEIRDAGKLFEVELTFFQSNHEGDIVDFIQHNLRWMDGCVINPAAFTKTGYSILDALTATDIPYVEVHLSNIFARGNWHEESIFASKAVGCISGFKGYVYILGLQGICTFIKNRM